MRPLSAVELLDVWESGSQLSVIDKTLHLLSIASSNVDTAEIADLSIGERDFRLFQLREWMFGSHLVNTATCPYCSELVEWEGNIEDLKIRKEGADPARKVFNLSQDGFNIQFRLPNTRDISLALSDPQFQSDPKRLLSRMILYADHNEVDCMIDDLPDSIVAAINKSMEEADPQADIQIVLNCSGCTFVWQAQFDIMSYLWTEIENWAKHILQEVCLIAKAFGWSEKEILNLSHQRRQSYLEMIRS